MGIEDSSSAGEVPGTSPPRERFGRLLLWCLLGSVGMMMPIVVIQFLRTSSRSERLRVQEGIARKSEITYYEDPVRYVELRRSGDAIFARHVTHVRRRINPFSSGQVTPSERNPLFEVSLDASGTSNPLRVSPAPAPVEGAKVIWVEDEYPGRAMVSEDGSRYLFARPSLDGGWESVALPVDARSSVLEDVAMDAKRIFALCQATLWIHERGSWRSYDPRFEFDSELHADLIKREPGLHREAPYDGFRPDGIFTQNGRLFARLDVGEWGGGLFMLNRRGTEWVPAPLETPDDGKCLDPGPRTPQFFERTTEATYCGGSLNHMGGTWGWIARFDGNSLDLLGGVDYTPCTEGIGLPSTYIWDIDVDDSGTITLLSFDYTLYESTSAGWRTLANLDDLMNEGGASILRLDEHRFLVGTIESVHLVDLATGTDHRILLPSGDPEARIQEKRPRGGGSPFSIAL